MSGIEKIKEKILEDANLKAENLLEHTQKELEKKEKKAKERFNKQIEHEEQKAKEKAEQSYERIVAKQKLEGRKLHLAALRESVDQAFENALEKMGEMSHELYVDIFSKMIASSLSEGENIILLAKGYDIKDEKEFLKAIKKQAPDHEIEIGKEKVEARGGVVIKNGKIQSNLTFETLIRFEKSDLEAQVLKRLFEGSQ